MKVNHKSLKLGVAFALVSTVGITSAEIIKQELSNKNYQNLLLLLRKQQQLKVQKKLNIKKKSKNLAKL